MRKGPRLPNALRKELEILNPTNADGSNSDDDINSDDANDLYEYEAAIPEEESKKNRRYDPVEDRRYKFSEDKDEDIGSDEGDIEEDDDDDADGSRGDQKGDDIEEEDEGRHARMLEGITGLPRDAFEGRKRKTDVVITEAYPESEYNPSRSDGHLSIQDLLDPLHGKPGFSKLRKSMDRMEKKSKVISAPLPKMDREKVERKVAYEFSKKDITKWEPLVKRNREAPTIYFDENIDLGFSTVGAIASEFEPRTDFEKKIASLVNDNELVEAHRKDGARLLELNKISVEDVKDRQDRLAKMRNLLFRHEMKAKRVKKIKSKTYHRLLKKDRLKAAATEIEMDPEASKELAMKQEFKRAEERLTLKHKNSSKWAKRILERGLAVQDEGTRAAISEQLQQHALLTRKMKSMKDGSSSDESSEDDDDDDDSYAGSDEDGAQKLLEKAKEKTTKVLGEEDEIPKSGVLSLPFMVRGMKKRKEAADEEAKLALQEFESSLKQLEDKDEVESRSIGPSSGRRVFGAPIKQHQESGDKIKTGKHYGNSDSEDDYEAREDVDVTHGRMNYEQKDMNVDPSFLREESEIGHDPVFKSFEDIVKDPGSKTTYEVAIFAANSWKKKKNLPEDVEKIKSAKEANVENSSRITQPNDDDQDIEEGDEGSDSDGGHMVDGILSAGTKSNYELPSQTDLIRGAFAGDDVEEDFEKDKQGILNKENPEAEKPVVLPGWGQWTNIQRKRGLPSWMLAEHADAKKNREEAVKKRKDAHLKHVIISEKIDKKAEKLHTAKLPYPFTSKEVFEQSLRVPIGPESNPATAIGALNRPEVVKRAGVIIKPIKYEELNPHERTEDHRQGGQKQRNKSSGKAVKRKNTKGIKAK